MRASWMKGILGAVAVAAAPSAAAQVETPGEALRVEVGGVHIGSSGCRPSHPVSCEWWAIPGLGRPGLGAAVLGASYDRPLGRTANLTVGGRLML